MAPQTLARKHVILFFAYIAIILCVGVHGFIHSPTNSQVGSQSWIGRKVAANDECTENDNADRNRRRTLLSFGLIPTVTLTGSELAQAERGRQPFTFFVPTKNTTSAEESIRKDPMDVETPSLSSELCLIRLLPVKNPVFKSLSLSMQSLSSLRSEGE